ncbi:28S ribosomal protein S34, mitochondrial [Drosophila innubila]|uniref:28S ribosomal protein S34, mitochondrial n=1 Tax=Drosophila innubila TaxID=198719 RepID=UPI00148CCFCB|nr:28S ribosomal protein S34, mitochondrial [Drosophila innubila]
MSQKVIKYIGRTTDFRGNTLWELVGSLPDWGVGRMLIRNMFQRYPEPCYMRILKVQAVDEKPNEERKVRVLVEKTWRGVKQPKPVEIYSTSYKADYELVPTEEEHKYLQNAKQVQPVILPTKIEFPPLLREYIKDETGAANPLMNVHFKKTHNKQARLAQPGEKPTLQVSMDLGQPKPVSAKLYEGLL